MKILIVENEPDQAELYRALFEPDHEVVVFQDGEQAVEYLKEHSTSLDAVVTDHDLNGSINGLGVIREARKFGFQGTIVMVTGSEERDLAEGVRRVGGDLLLWKPFQIPELEEALGIGAPTMV